MESGARNSGIAEGGGGTRGREGGGGGGAGARGRSGGTRAMRESYPSVSQYFMVIGGFANSLRREGCIKAVFHHVLQTNKSYRKVANRGKGRRGKGKEGREEREGREGMS